MKPHLPKPEAKPRNTLGNRGGFPSGSRTHIRLLIIKTVCTAERGPQPRPASTGKHSESESNSRLFLIRGASRPRLRSTVSETAVGGPARGCEPRFSRLGPSLSGCHRVLEAEGQPRCWGDPGIRSREAELPQLTPAAPQSCLWHYTPRTAPTPHRSPRPRGPACHVLLGH